MKALHILAGLLSLLAGFTALYSTKGAWLHRNSGRVFSYAMLFMAASGTLMSFLGGINRGNIVAGTLTFYLVATGLLTVIRTVPDSRRLLASFTVIATLATGAGWLFGWMASRSPSGNIDHIPGVALYMFASIGTLAVIGDLRTLRANAIHGAPRLSRHLWRMTYALWIASSSFFFGQARFLPHWFRAAHLNAVPIFLVLGTLLYWLVRIRMKRQLPSPANAIAATAWLP